MLHLLGVRLKNYRNFDDCFLSLSSKYDVICEEKLESINEERAPLKHKKITITRIEIKSKNNIKDKISYICLAGKNGTGKTTAITYETDDVYNSYISDIGLESVNYRVYLYVDENEEKIIVSHNYKPDTNNPGYGPLTVFEDYGIFKLDGEPVDKIVANHNIECFKSLYEIKSDSSDFGMYSQKDNEVQYVGAFQEQENLSKDHYEIIKLLGIDNKNIAFEFNIFNDLNDNNLKMDEKCAEFIVKNGKFNYNMSKFNDRETFNTYVNAYLYILKNNYGTNDVLTIEKLKQLKISDFAEGDQLDELKSILDKFYKVYKINNSKLLYQTRDNTILNYLVPRINKHGDDILPEKQKAEIQSILDDLADGNWTGTYKILYNYKKPLITREITLGEFYGSDEDKKSYKNIHKGNFRFFINYKNKKDKDYKLLESLFNELYDFNKKYITEPDFHNKIRYSQLFNCSITNTSVGEKQSIDLLAKFKIKIYEAIDKYKELGNPNGKKLSILLTLDEPDNHMHPEWQRSLKLNIDKILNDIIDKENKENKEDKLDLYFQIIMTTHSPFIISDFKKDELVLLDFSKENNREFTTVSIGAKNFYGANIYDIMADGFFLESGIGAFTENEIKVAIENLKHSTETEGLESKVLDKIKSLKDEISDVFVKDYLNTIIDNYKAENCKNDEEKDYLVKEKIKELEIEILKLKENLSSDKE